MNEAQRIAHLLRRFGIGAGSQQLQPYLAKGFERAKDAILNDERIDEQFPISHWHYATQEDKKVDANAYHVGGWWALRMMMTRRPFQEKMTFFWHDHFALDAEKISEAPTMLAYLETMRTQGRGNFETLLKQVVHQGALFASLDNHVSNRILPNENFARELLELFTLGEGHYSEKDVREVSRAFTGWSMHYVGIGLEIPYETLRDRMTANKLAMLNACYVPALHDDGSKTILGKSGNFDGDDVMKQLANHPTTAHTLCGKLWAFFGSSKPHAGVIDRMAATWLKSNGHIKSVLKTMVDDPAFWSPECVRQLHKSPIDFTVGLFRDFGWHDIMLQLFGKPKGDFEPLKKELREAGGGLHYLMSQQGLSLLFPPDVAGWDWGESWVTTDNLIRRRTLADVIFWGGGDDRPFSVYLANHMKTIAKVQSTEGLVDVYCAFFDVPTTDQQKQTLVSACESKGGLKALDNKDSAANLFASISKLAFAIPEFHLC